MEMGQHLLPPGLPKNLFLYPINGVAGIWGLQYYVARIKLWFIRKIGFVVTVSLRKEDGRKWGLRRVVFCVAGWCDGSCAKSCPRANPSRAGSGGFFTYCCYSLFRAITPHYVKKLGRKNYRRKSWNVRVIVPITVTVIFLEALGRSGNWILRIFGLPWRKRNIFLFRMCIL